MCVILVLYQMIIYKITNIINNKSYIGQTTGSFKTRYRAGKWWKYTDNILLINSHAKYGLSSFTVDILEENVPSIEELNRLEIFYAIKFNSYSPNGYNLRGCGDNKFCLPETIEKQRVHSLKTRYVRKIETWETIEIKDLVRFCQENGLSYSSMYSMIKGGREIVSTGGYCNINLTKREFESKRRVKFKNEPIWLSRNGGEIFYVENPKEFAKKHNLEKGSFYKLIAGQMLHYKGYRLPENIGKYAKNIKKFTLCKNFGTPQEFINLSNFCKEEGLSPMSMCKVLGGEMKIHRGWHLPNLTEEDLFMTGLYKKISVDLLDPDGKLVHIKNLAFFCHKNNYHYPSFFNLAKGVSRTCFGWTTSGNENLFNTYVSPNGVFYKSIGIKRICCAFDLNPACLNNIQNPKAQCNYHKGWTSFRNGNAPKVQVSLKEQGFLEKYVLV